ncbi:MAG TPA: hypothetical protein VK574_16175 [Terracidiphilus sp.]|nr:hypothetical protein [Terracidiphilus sp.]
MAVPKSWSPDGRYLIYAKINPGTAADLFALPVAQPDPHPLVLAQTQATEDQGQFSPDGRWVGGWPRCRGAIQLRVPPVPRFWGPGKKRLTAGSASTPATARPCAWQSMPTQSPFPGLDRRQVRTAPIATEGEEVELACLLITDALAFHALRPSA